MLITYFDRVLQMTAFDEFYHITHARQENLTLILREVLEVFSP